MRCTRHNTATVHAMLHRSWRCSFVLLGIFSSLLGVTPCLGKSRCGALSRGDVDRLERYFDLTRAAAFDRQLVPSVAHVVASIPVNDACYWKLTIRFDGDPRDKSYYLTPDRRFLSIALSDTRVDPMVARATEERELSATLVEGNPPTLGNNDAPVTVVIFEDFDCPYCKRLDSWIAELPAATKSNVRFVFRNLPLAIHPAARSEAALAVCSGMQSRAAYFVAREVLYSHQGSFAAESARDEFATFSRGYHTIDVPTLDSCLKQGLADAQIEQDSSLAARLQLFSTPSIFVNGRRLAHLSTESDLAAALDLADVVARAKVPIGGQ